jgi:hypothetical protein
VQVQNLSDVMAISTGLSHSLAKGPGVNEPLFVVANFGYNAGGWRVKRHPRLLADLTGDGRADIVGFGDDGVYVWTVVAFPPT